MKRDIKPRDIMTRAAFENAMVIVMATGGSTNAGEPRLGALGGVGLGGAAWEAGAGLRVQLRCPRSLPGCQPSQPACPPRRPPPAPFAVLHLIAMARACGLELTLDDFQRVSDRVPFIADLKPSGKYVMEDVHKVGGRRRPSPGPGRPSVGRMARAGWRTCALVALQEARVGLHTRGGASAAVCRRSAGRGPLLAPRSSRSCSPPSTRTPAQVGGTPAVLKYLLERNLIDGSCLTVTGKTLAENLAACPGLKEGQQGRAQLRRQRAGVAAAGHAAGGCCGWARLVRCRPGRQPQT